MTAQKLGTFSPYQKAAERAFSPSKAAASASDSLIFLDTNVLLAPYRTSTDTLEAIKNAYSLLRNEGRLIVPAQVAREFARNRPALIGDLLKDMREARGLGLNRSFEPPLIVHDLPEHAEAKKHFDLINRELKIYRGALDKLISKIENWQSTDPVLDVYRQLFDSSNVTELSISASDLAALAKQRFDARMPPGYRDKGKDDGGVGDLAIWFTILEVSASKHKDALFVTADEKDDWYHQAGKSRLFPRYELLEEFREHTSKSFGLISLSDLLQALGVPDKAVREVKDRERSIWRDYGSAVERIAMSDVVRRLRAVAPEATISPLMGYLDWLVELPSDRIGIEIVLGSSQAIIPFGYTSHDVVRARQAIQSGLVNEAVLLIVGYPGVPLQLDGWFAEDSSQGPGLSIIVTEIAGSRLRVLRSQTTHPVVLSAFPVEQSAANPM
jgi:hypothetical protein